MCKNSDLMLLHRFTHFAGHPTKWVNTKIASCIPPDAGCGDAQLPTILLKCTCTAEKCHMGFCDLMCLWVKILL